MSVSYDRLSIADGVIHEDQLLSFRLAVTSLADSRQQVSIALELEDFYGRLTELLPTQELVLEPGVPARLTIEADPEGFGVFKVRWRSGNQDGELLTLARLPLELAERGPCPDSSFGNHVHADFHYANLARKLGVKWTLIKDGPQHYTNWWSAEPRRGEFRFFDEEIAVFASHNIQAAAGVFRTAPWASSGPPDPTRPHFTRHPPENFADFERLMAVLAGHYRGTIDHWEIWNEPHVSAFWSGTPEEYVKLLEAGYRGVKKGNPDAVVIGGGGLSLSDRDFMARVLDAGLVEHLDVLSIHGYSDATTPLGEGLMNQMLEKLRNDIADSGGREDLPIWVTEHTTFSLSFFERYWPTFERQRREFHFRQQSARLVREHVMALAGGVDRVFYYWFWPVGGFFEHSRSTGL